MEYTPTWVLDAKQALLKKCGLLSRPLEARFILQWAVSPSGDKLTYTWISGEYVFVETLMYATLSPKELDEVSEVFSKYPHLRGA